MNITEKEYYIGLDCGTNSVGWAVTDTDYNVLKFNGKAMWGSHLFDEAKTSEERRVHRCSRRRLQRKKERIDILQALFADEIAKVDPEFFLRLNDSGYYAEDKHVFQHNSLFNDKNYNDKDFFKDFPTIYHLRLALVNGTIGNHDPRLVYLALHHILKHRGHFLFSGSNVNDAITTDKIDNIKELIASMFDVDPSEISIDITQLKNALKLSGKKLKEKELNKAIIFPDK